LSTYLDDQRRGLELEAYSPLQLEPNLLIAFHVCHSPHSSFLAHAREIISYGERRHQISMSDDSHTAADLGWRITPSAPIRPTAVQGQNANNHRRK